MMNDKFYSVVITSEGRMEVLDEEETMADILGELTSLNQEVSSMRSEFRSMKKALDRAGVIPPRPAHQMSLDDMKLYEPHDEEPF